MEAFRKNKTENICLWKQRNMGTLLIRSFLTYIGKYIRGRRSYID